jgi:poly-beta-1,6-N-acetyl-D-glucosamine N-deacetylase
MIRPFPLLGTLLCWLLPGLNLLSQEPLPGNAVILQYHHVSTATPPSTSISPADFRRHMDYLRESGFAVLRLEDVVAALQAGATLPDKTAVISFDDGYISVYQEAFPLLQEYGWPFTIFVPTSLVGSNPRLYTNWDQLREMAAAGATLANHTVSHSYLLARLAGEDESAWLQRIEQDLLAAEAEIERQSGQSHKLFAYTYGEYDQALQALITKLGFVGIGQHSGPIGPASDFSALPRFPFSGSYVSMNTYPTKVNSLAFDARLLPPYQPLTDSARPEAVLEFGLEYRFAALNCFNNDRPMQLSRIEGEARQFRVSPVEDNRSRRFRYNCTAPGRDGRFHWYSIPFTNPAVPE